MSKGRLIAWGSGTFFLLLLLGIANNYFWAAPKVPSGPSINVVVPDGIRWGTQVQIVAGGMQLAAVFDPSCMGEHLGSTLRAGSVDGRDIAVVIENMATLATTDVLRHAKVRATLDSDKHQIRVTCA